MVDLINGGPWRPESRCVVPGAILQMICIARSLTYLAHDGTHFWTFRNLSLGV